jgi:4-hydroxythreonine-4-phosphate dehydrogenase
MPSSKPRLLITCGDPAGIGPEIAALAWRDASLHATARLRVVANVALMQRVVSAERIAGTANALPAIEQVEAVDPRDSRPSTPQTLLVIEPPLPCETIPIGAVSAEGGRFAAAAVLMASQLVRGGDAEGIVTGPLNKAALAAAGYDVPGHTELLARDCGLADDAVSMMLWLPAGPGLPGSDGLGVVHVTLHEALATAVHNITPAKVTAAGRRLRQMLRRLLGREPRLAVAALNPHGGEGGLFGDEELRLIAPAVDELANEGGSVVGPLPADTLFAKAAAGTYDGVVAQYHDQGHIPIKLLGMHRAVNITLGLPIIRTSVAHGTAFDLVGTGEADPSSMRSAIQAATRLAATVDQAATTP